MGENAMFEQRRFALGTEVKRCALVFKESELRKKTGLTAAQAADRGAVLALLRAVNGGLIQAVFRQRVAVSKEHALISVETMEAQANAELEKARLETMLIF